MRQHTSAYVSKRTSAYVSIRQHTYLRVVGEREYGPDANVRQDTSGYVRIRTCGSWVSVNMAPMCSLPGISIDVTFTATPGGHTSAYASMRQHTPACVNIRQRTSAYVRETRVHTLKGTPGRLTFSSTCGILIRDAYVSIRQHTSTYFSRRLKFSST